MPTRILSISFVVSLILGLISPISTFGQEDEWACGTESDYPLACKLFVPIEEPLKSQIDQLSFSAEYLPSEEAASAHLKDDAEFFATFPKTKVVESGFDFGDEHAWIYVANEDKPDVVFAILMIRVGSVVADWTAIGESFDALEIFDEIYTSMDIDGLGAADNERERTTRLLPKVSDLPEGFELHDEVLLGFPEEQAEGDEELTREELEATIAALEEDVNEEESSPNSTTSTSSSQPLEIGSITSKDAGIGDGSIYVYVEVTNNSDGLYSYVGLEGTCYSASGSVVGTGLGNTANVASGETAVITMIFLKVPGCDNVKVRFDALTGLL